MGGGDDGAVGGTADDDGGVSSEVLLARKNVELYNMVMERDVELRELKDCRLFITGQPNVLHIRGLDNCLVCIGPVSRSLLIRDCVDCTFAIACQQLRVHDAERTDFYLHVTSRAIIEDCAALRFAPFSWEYSELDADFAASELSRTSNSWATPDDFEWLNPTKASPNWSVLPETERLTDWEAAPLKRECGRNVERE